MDILFKREQAYGKYRRINFRLWAKIELSDDEREMIDKYDLHEAVLIIVEQPGLLKWSFIAGVVAGLIAAAVSYQYTEYHLPIGGAAALLAAFVYFNERRETIYVRDLMHGRNFRCNSVVELARKEAWLQTIVAFLRQVMESSKHWDGTESHAIEALPPDEARQVILRGI